MVLYGFWTSDKTKHNQAPEWFRMVFLGKTEAKQEITGELTLCLIMFCVVLVSNQWFCMVFGRATDQTQSGSRMVPHGICMKDRSQTGNQQYGLLVFWVFWMLSLGV